jgi:hypothetical protein
LRKEATKSPKPIAASAAAKLNTTNEYNKAVGFPCIRNEKIKIKLIPKNIISTETMSRIIFFRLKIIPRAPTKKIKKQNSREKPKKAFQLKSTGEIYSDERAG